MCSTLCVITFNDTEKQSFSWGEIFFLARQKIIFFRTILHKPYRAKPELLG